MKPRILALSYLFPNRAYPNFGIFVLNRLKAVQKYCNITVIAPIPKFPFMEGFERFRGYSRIPTRDIIQGLNVAHPRFPVIPRFIKWWDSFAYWAVVAPLAHRLRNQVDLVDVHWVYPDILAAFMISKLYKKKFIITVRGVEALHINENRFRKKIIDFLLLRADHVIALSQHLRSLIETIGVPTRKISIILNGTDNHHFQLMDQNQCREQLGLPKGIPIIVSVGSLLLSKGHDLLINAVSKLSDQYNVELYIIGGTGSEGDDRAAIERLMNSLALSNVHLVGRRPHEELALWYNAADLFCLASRSEGCPNVVMEALACGTPVVVTNVGAIVDIVEKEEEGHIVEAGKIDELEMALRKGLERTWDRRLISRRGQRRTWDECARQVLEVYNLLLIGNYEANITE